MSDSSAATTDARRTVLLIAPLLIVALAVGVLAVLLESSRRQQPSAAPVVAEVTSTTSSPASGSTAAARPTIALATPWGILPANQPVATETPAVAQEATVQPVLLLGPPTDSLFTAGSAISFYWQWPDELEEGQSFVVQAGADGQWREIGRVDGVNLGQLYRVTVDTSAVGLNAGSYLWQVVLEGAVGENSQIVAPPRSFRIVG